MIKAGSKLRIRKEYQDSGDDQITFVAVDNEDNGRIKIMAQVDLLIKPTQVVKVIMVELI